MTTFEMCLAVLEQDAFADERIIMLFGRKCLHGHGLHDFPNNTTITLHDHSI